MAGSASGSLSAAATGIRISSLNHRPRSTSLHCREQKGRGGWSAGTSRIFPHSGHEIRMACVVPSRALDPDEEAVGEVALEARPQDLVRGGFDVVLDPLELEETPVRVEHRVAGSVVVVPWLTD
jgi:hypothetical protein